MDNSNISFEENIVKLISLCHEGGYWDFKKEWYKNNGDLLHDIICMANNLHNRDAYIIIGVDEENGYCRLDMTSDPNRKNTQKIVDFLRDKKFTGGIRPVVYVKSLDLHNVSIDIIVVENNFQTPFFLTERYEKVNANNIYTRIVDTNTPINQSADINVIEYLWRKRFRLDESPLEKVRGYIQSPEEWDDSPIEYEMTRFYKYSPEYIIKQEQDESRTGYEFFFFSQVNSIPHWYTVTLYYHQTALEQFLLVGLDECRFLAVCPALSGIKFNNHRWDISYRYYEKDTLRYDLLNFYRNDAGYDYEFSRFMECVLVFVSKRERIDFESYVANNKALYKKYYDDVQDDLPYFENLKGYDMAGFKKQYSDALALQKLLVDYKKQ